MSITYATWNPSDKGTNMTLSWWNLIATWWASAWTAVRSNIWKSSWKWYWEVTRTSGTDTIIGIWNLSWSVNTYIGADANSWWYRVAWDFFTNNTWSWTPWTISVWDVIWVALDMDAGTIKFLKNNVDKWVAFSWLTGTIYAMVSIFNWVDTANFGTTALTYSPPAWFNAWLYTWDNASFFMFF